MPSRRQSRRPKCIRVIELFRVKVEISTSTEPEENVHAAILSLVRRGALVLKRAGDGSLIRDVELEGRVHVLRRSLRPSPRFRGCRATQ